MKILCKITALLGYVIIGLLAFALPNDPYEIIPSYSIIGFDKPLWLCLIIIGYFFYSIFLISFFYQELS